MNKVAFTTYESARVSIDATTFDHVVFRRCTMEYGGAELPGFTNCEFHECQWLLVGNAKNTVAFMRGVYHGFGEFGQQMIQSIFGQIMTHPTVAPPSAHE